MVSVDEREKAISIIFMLLQREQFAEEIKSLIAEREIPNSYKFHPSLMKSSYSGHRDNKQNTIRLSKHPILLQWKHNAINFFSQNEKKDNHYESAEHVGNIFRQKT